MKFDHWVLESIWILDFGIWNLLLRSIHIFFQLLRLKVGNQGVDHGLQPAIHDVVQLMQAESDAMVGQPILREIVRPDFFASIARPHL